MSKPDDPLPARWQYYNHRSSEADGGYVGDYGHGREEQLGETLLHIESGEPFTDEVRDRLDRVPHNRAKKHRRLRLHLLDLQRQEEPGYLDGPDDEDSRLLDQIHEALSPAEWQVECRLAEGETYAVVASDNGLSEGALKMRVSRWRTRVRETVAV